MYEVIIKDNAEIEVKTNCNDKNKVYILIMVQRAL